jgi:hypothetical protein
MATKRETKRTQSWVVTFDVVAPKDWTDDDIENAVEQALDGGVALPTYLDATFIRAVKEGV